VLTKYVDTAMLPATAAITAATAGPDRPRWRAASRSARRGASGSRRTDHDHREAECEHPPRSPHHATTAGEGGKDVVASGASRRQDTGNQTGHHANGQDSEQLERSKVEVPRRAVDEVRHLGQGESTETDARGKTQRAPDRAEDEAACQHHLPNLAGVTTSRGYQGEVTPLPAGAHSKRCARKQHDLEDGKPDRYRRQADPIRAGEIIGAVHVRHPRGRVLDHGP
jgi:hypothetical protein